MKKYGMLALATILMFSMTVMAQNSNPPQRPNGERGKFKQAERIMVSPEKRAERIAKELGLTDAQKADVQALFEKQFEKRHLEMEKVEKMREEMKTKMLAERKANDEDLAKIIGQENFQKLQSMRAEQMQKMKERRENKMRNSTENMPKNN
ncbi:MAG: hypothetical protein P4L34_05460 [Paludibacter sp.]|nr:hypothetical protein [Paludibacter sp.]